ncbi:unnamed protein product [Agarophyton chilense]|eukprot:gb/GEZJ01004920.1/.p1 GENE.gb/GEZJ01004920.1/~~gb/GEZJ01004920.1/.p1  ORF type:complete len:261 (-),score=39.63 gb/GEZJ01004920.1/:160-942(-)
MACVPAFVPALPLRAPRSSLGALEPPPPRCAAALTRRRTARGRGCVVRATRGDDSAVSEDGGVADKHTTREPPFEIRGFSLANVFLGAGALVTVSSFWSYIGSYGTASATSLGFVYGVPILLVGCALKYAELQPVPVTGSTEARAARQTRATTVQKKIYQDITRHRYGDEAHLAPALSSLGLVPRGEPCPVLKSAEERVDDDGHYCIRLIFYSVATPYKDWAARVDKFERFFGPNVRASVSKQDAQQRLVALSLCSVADA